jgi:hypothetical protein
MGEELVRYCPPLIGVRATENVTASDDFKFIFEIQPKDQGPVFLICQRSFMKRNSALKLLLHSYIPISEPAVIAVIQRICASSYR